MGRPRSLPVLVATLACGLLAGAVAAQSNLPPGHPPLQPEHQHRPTGPAPFKLAATLYDGTRELELQAPGVSAEKDPIADAQVLVESWNVAGEEETLTAQTNENGFLEIDLDTRAGGSHVIVQATRDGALYFSARLLVGVPPPAQVPMYRAADTSESVSQMAIRVVTEIENMVTNETRVHVRQIISTTATGTELYIGRRTDDGDYAPTLWFPVPEGARMESLSLDNQALAEIGVREDPVRGRGVPVDTALYPGVKPQSATMIGTFSLPAEPGAILDLGMRTDVSTRGFTAALEIGCYRFVDSGDGPEFQQSGRIPLDGRQPTMTWRTLDVPEGTNIVANVRVLEASERESLAVKFRVQLFDGSIELYHGHGGQATQADGHETLLTGASVRVRAYGSDAESKVVDATTDIDGFVDIDLGQRPFGEQILIEARSGDVAYYSEPLMVEMPPQGKLGLYRISRQPGDVIQNLFRIATETENLVTKKKRVHVRQVMMVQNRGFGVFLGLEQPTGGFAPTLIFPVPPEATMSTLTVNGEDHDVATVSDPTWGTHGVAIKPPLYPTQSARSAQLVGTYYLDLEEGDEFDLGLELDLPTSSFLVAVEHRRFGFYGNDGVGPELVSQGKATQMPGTAQNVDIYGAQSLPAGTTVKARVTFGDPGIAPRTWYMAGIWIGGLALALAIGRALSQRGRASPERKLLDQLADLDQRLARGELEVAEYKREQKRIRRDLESRGAVGEAVGAAKLAEKLAPEQTLLDDMAVKLEVLAEKAGSEELVEELKTMASRARKRQVEP